MDLYEHRVTWVEPGQFGDFREVFLGETWGRLEAAGYRPLCLLNPVIGGMAEEVHSFRGLSPRGMTGSVGRRSSAAAPMTMGPTAKRGETSWWVRTSGRGSRSQAARWR